jgi:hypothetical protein
VETDRVLEREERGRILRAECVCKASVDMRLQQRRRSPEQKGKDAGRKDAGGWHSGSDGDQTTAAVTSASPRCTPAGKLTVEMTSDGRPSARYEQQQLSSENMTETSTRK